MAMFRETSEGIQIDAEPVFIPERSNPEKSYYFFAYRIRIKNVGRDTAQLMRRHWIITDANGKVEEVEGEGVVGEQPRLAPGAVYEYTSFCPLPTSTGTMKGTYKMRHEDGRMFEVRIPQFVLRESWGAGGMA